MKKRRVILFFIVFCMLLNLAACNVKNGKSDDTTSTTGTAPAVGSYTEKETGADGEIANLISENYRIVWGSKDREDCVVKGGQLFNQKVLSGAKVHLKMISDTAAEPNGYEIIIGTTTRPENVDASTLTYYDYGWSFKTSNVVIYGGSADALENAVNRFFEKYWDNEVKELAVPFGCTFTATYNYPYPDNAITVNGTAIGDATILYDKSHASAADEVYYGFGRLTGKRLRTQVYSMGQDIPANAILVGINGIEMLGGTYRVVDKHLSFDGNDGNSKELDVLSDVIKAFFTTEFPADKKSVELNQIQKKEVVPTLEHMIYADQSYREELDRNFDAAKNSLLAAESQWKVSGNGQIFYVSPNGNDSNDGLTPTNAWKTIARVNSATLPEGSVVLFERNGVWNREGTLNLKKGVTYSAYGTGEKPMLSNYVDAGNRSDWVSVGTNLWVYNGSYHSVDVAEKANDTSIPGSYIVSTNYDNDQNDDIANIVLNQGQGYGVKVTKHLSADISVSIGTVDTGMGWSITRLGDRFANQNDLKSNLEFYHNPDTSRLYLYYDGGNPADVFEDIKLVVRGYLAGAGRENSINVTIDNLALKYAGAHGISVGYSKNVTIRNCEIGWIGGSIQTYDFGGRSFPTRFGEGIQNWGDCDGFYIENCYIYQIYDGAASSQQSVWAEMQSCIMKDIQVTNCLFEKNTTSVEMWLNLTTAQGEKNHLYGFEEMRITGNLIRNMGCGFGQSRPDTPIYDDQADGMTNGFGYPAPHFTDCIVSENIMWGSNRHYISGLYWNMDTGYILYGNTFLTEYGSGFGLLPTDFKHVAQWDVTNYPYTDEVIGKLQDLNIIGDNSFYFLAPTAKK